MSRKHTLTEMESKYGEHLNATGRSRVYILSALAVLHDRLGAVGEELRVLKEVNSRVDGVLGNWLLRIRQ